ncbi:MAG: peptide chain release factor N(5)-glutamine methyltransferase [Deltaproteobacteria bacterium]|nr:peptide chain release factor N(5)-glutamine methyltransferase [Deltaproteobacteria bacterium]
MLETRDGIPAADSPPPADGLAARLRWAERHLAARGVASPRLDAELLLADVLGTDRAGLRLGRERPLDRRLADRFVRLVERRGAREPLQYLRGRQEFFSRDFTVDRAVLVPRPETEILVEVALERARRVARPSILDLGTGSGAIAVTLALELPQARIVATEISEPALSAARANAVRLGAAARVQLRRGDLLAPCAGERFDLVVSNPPYVPSAEIAALEPEVGEWEPRLALDGGPDGLAVHRRIAAEVASAVAPGGEVVIEIGRGQGAAVAAIFAAAGFAAREARRDLAGIERVLVFARAAGAAVRGIGDDG